MHEEDAVHELEKEIENLKLHAADSSDLQKNGVQDESDDEQPPPGFTRHDRIRVKTSKRV